MIQIHRPFHDGRFERGESMREEVKERLDRNHVRSRQVRQPVLWGLSAAQIHDAFWRSRGVHVVRRGEAAELPPGAELFLLIDDGQLVFFDLGFLSDRLTWRDAVVTRVRLVHECDQRYSEHVILTDDGTVERIERRYRPELVCSTRLMMTPSRKIAKLWNESECRRAGLSEVRRRVAREHIDHWSGRGALYLEGDPRQEHRMLIQLAAHWHCPNQTIDGLVESEPGVWHLVNEHLQPDAIRVGPLWIGRGSGALQHECLVGPAWLADAEHAKSDASITPVLKPFADVEPITRTSPAESRSTAFQKASPGYLAVKRTVDIIGSACALVVLSPIMAVVALLIVFEDGRPIFFGHTRQGRGGRLFRCWKFRTMHRNAHAMARDFEALNICDGPQVLLENDPRVTRIGRLLRVTSLDELPQFWNVLAGHMSLVGPRPSPDDENQYCPAWRDLRLSVRPGITGLWQLQRTRRRGSDFQEWIKYDIQYVREAGLWLDMKLMVQTALMMLTRRRSRGSA